MGSTRIERKYSPNIFENEVESLDLDQYVIATYWMEQPASVDFMEMVQGIVSSQSTGTWARVQGEASKLVEKYTAKVIGFYLNPTVEGEKRRVVVQVALPVYSWPTSIPNLLSAVAGIVFFAPNYIRLKGLWFPKSFVKEFKGPKFGVSGVREMLGVKERPILISVIKPNLGLTPEETADLCYEAAVGGVDIFKDDEMMADNPDSRFHDRLASVMEAIDRAMEESGEKKLYCINVTDRIDRIMEKAERAVESGANALMLNYTAGLPALQALAEEESLNVPILFHSDMMGPYWRGEAGIDATVHHKLVRLAGADFFPIPGPWGRWEESVISEEEVVRCNQILQSEFYHIKRVWGSASGGIHPAVVPILIERLGLDCIVGAGGGVHGHPRGSRAGAKAFRQAIDAVMEGKTLEEAAEEQEELRAALDLWGSPA